MVAALAVGAVLTSCTANTVAMNASADMAVAPAAVAGFDPRLLPAVAQPWVTWILKAGSLCDAIKPEDVAAVVAAESSWDRKQVHEGHYGLGQFAPDEWRQGLGKDADGDGKADIFNAADAIYSAGSYLCFINKHVRELADKGGYGIPKGLSDDDFLNLTVIGYNQGVYLGRGEGRQPAHRLRRQGTAHEHHGRRRDQRDEVHQQLPEIQARLHRAVF
ncbi:MAG: hypothetical protein HOV66_06565, partial [Streptomycetaceae bacterium]|nr:hypothetical protein [Streptomycetaceae bacterium]